MNEFTLPHNHGSIADAKKLHESLADKVKFESVSELFKILSDSCRIRIFWLLSHHEECIVNISALLGISSPLVSHHLRPMKDSGIIESRRDGKEVYYRIADSEECMLLHKTIESVMEITCPNDKPNSLYSPSETVQKVHQYLVEHLDERITIEELSKKYLINQTTLKNTFKEVYGTSIAAHINEHRMEKAAEMLTSTNLSMLEIAESVGFSSQSRFTAVFKKEFGCTPTEFRNK